MRVLLVAQLAVGSVAPLVELLMLGALGPRRRRYDPEAAVVVSGGALRVSRLGVFRVGMSELRPAPPAEVIGRHIVCPTVAVVGAQSAQAAQRYATTLTSVAPDASMEVVDHVFNLVALEHPERVVEAVVALWSRSDGGDLVSHRCDTV
ncbi:hypothetical protein [Luteimicrobium album]|nr:hypothetical protein [Luteimicrobium album]